MMASFLDNLVILVGLLDFVSGLTSAIVVVVCEGCKNSLFILSHDAQVKANTVNVINLGINLSMSRVLLVVSIRTIFQVNQTTPLRLVQKNRCNINISRTILAVQFFFLGWLTCSVSSNRDMMLSDLPAVFEFELNWLKRIGLLFRGMGIFITDQSSTSSGNSFKLSNLN